KLFAALVEAAIYPEGVDEAIQMRPSTESQCHSGHNAAPDAAVEPVGDSRPPVKECQHRHFIDFVDIKPVAQCGPGPGRGFFELIRLLSRRRSVAVEPPRQADAQEDDEG